MICAVYLRTGMLELENVFLHLGVETLKRRFACRSQLFIRNSGCEGVDPVLPHRIGCIHE